MTQEELNFLMDEHDKWLHNRSQGRRLELHNVNLQGCNISKRWLIGSILENVNLSNSNCENVSFYGDNTNLKNVKFCGANLRKAEFSQSKIENIDFGDANLEEAVIDDIVIAKHLEFDNAKMDKVTFIKSSFDFASFKNTSLVNADFFRTYCYESSFENADLRKARFSYATIYDCDVKGAIIEGANFSDARDLPEEWKQAIGWYSEEQENIRRIKAYLKENPVR